MIYVREEVCMGCKLCEVHCATAHSASHHVLTAFKAEAPRPLPRIRVGQSPSGFLPVQCRHCADAPCVSACLAGALHKDPDTGIVEFDRERCIGCWTCILVCPYGAIQRDTARHTIVKCDLCPGLEVPACVANCPNEVLLSSSTGPYRSFGCNGHFPRSYGQLEEWLAYASRTPPAESRYLIIGNSAGGIAAAEAIREVDPEGTITILSEEPYPPYSRPAISHYLAGERSLEEMLLRPLNFYEKNNIHLILGVGATRLDVDAHTVELADGRRLAWRKLLLATGGSPIVPPTKGSDKDGVFTFTAQADAEGLRQWVSTGDRVVVVGGGLIGVSVAEGLVKLGAKIVMVELMDRVLGTALDREASRIVADALQRQGVELVLQQTAQEIIGRPADDRRVGGVVLRDGRTIPCQAVVFAIGVTPRTDLVAGTQIATNRGIVVDRRMVTNCPDVYACGDVAEAYDFVRDSSRLIPVWPNATEGGRTAGYNMAGQTTTYAGSTGMNSFSYFGLSILAAGIVGPGEDEGYEVLSTTSRQKDLYRKLVLKDDRIVGIVCVGRIEGTGILFGLMKNGVDVGSFKDSLLSDDFNLAKLPEDLRHERLPLAPPEELLVNAP